jgi:tRNA threonylcarbamoyladenosine biosynthesis protein TsaB
VAQGPVLAFDTATAVATIALVAVPEQRVLGERTSRAAAVLDAADELLRDARLTPADLSGLVVGTGPGSFTGIRIGLAAIRGLALSTGLPVGGVSTLEALAAGAPESLPVIDARRREVFTIVDGKPVARRPEELELEPGTSCVGDGAVRYRLQLEAAGAEIPPDDAIAHLPRARFHAELARDLGDPELVHPIYVRVPDAKRATA